MLAHRARVKPLIREIVNCVARIGLPARLMKEGIWRQSVHVVVNRVAQLAAQPAFASAPGVGTLGGHEIGIRKNAWHRQ